MKEIGGYFGTEYLAYGVQSVPHSDGIFVNTGHNAFALILQSLPNIRHIYIPRYVCHIIPETLCKLNISFSFYYINFNLEISVFPEVQDEEYILVVNYFGIKDRYINELIGLYGGSRLIVDNVQAFYYNNYPGINSFYSVRKFFGVPDGGIACSSAPQMSLISDNNSVAFNSHQIIRDTMGAEAGFKEFRNNERLLRIQPLSFMSSYSYSILPKIPYDIIKQIRLNNFDYLSSKLTLTNKMSLDMNTAFMCPMVYPYYSDNLELRNKLIQNKIFIPTYWPEILVFCEKDSVEYNLARKLLPLPIDQRYGEEDMQRIIDVILN